MASPSKANPQTSTAKISQKVGTVHLPVPPIFDEITTKVNECYSGSGADASSSSNVPKIAKFQIDCNVFAFFLIKPQREKGNFGSWPLKNLDLSFVPVITGDPHNGQLTSIPEYLEQTWPNESCDLIHALRDAISDAYYTKDSFNGTYLRKPTDQIVSDTVQAQKKRGGPSLRCFIQYNGMVVLAYGESQYLTKLCQMLVWLGMVCQNDEVGGRSKTCISNFDLQPSKEARPFGFPKHLSKPDFTITISYTLEDVDGQERLWYSQSRKTSQSPRVPLAEKACKSLHVCC